MAQDDVAAKQAEDRRKSREASKKVAEETLSDQEKERTANNAAAMERMDGSQPTPTQRENDLARLGHPVMEKEDDGSGPDREPNTALSAAEQKRQADEAKRRTAKPAGDGAPYSTRETKPEVAKT